MDTPEILALIEDYCAKHGDMTPTAFGKEAMGDPNFVSDLRDGRELRSKTRERLLSFIQQERAA